MQIAALSVGALLTLLEHARKQDSLINGKDSVGVGSKNGQLSNYLIVIVSIGYGLAHNDSRI